jgi:hypothetical protein
MPAFTFEKISPPARGAVTSAPISSTEQKQRGVVVQVLGRFVEARVHRIKRATDASLLRRDKPPSE